MAFIDLSVDQLIMIAGIIIPAIIAIFVAKLKISSKKHTIPRQPPSELDIIKQDVDYLLGEIEKQHIKVDDLSERISWLEGQANKR